MNRAPFTPFDEHRAVQIYQRLLPHWRQEGATYFVTFRLGDALPLHVTRAWDGERYRWIATRVSGICEGKDDVATAVARLSPAEQQQYHRHFNRKLQEYLDAGVGDCHLRMTNCLRIVREQILSLDGVSCHVGDFVIMPNHVHILITPMPDKRLEQILRQMKGASSRDCNLAVGRTGRFWQPESYDHIVRSLEQLLAYRDYISTNPQKAGIIVEPPALYRATWMDEWYK
jgi:type I restriction enzyme R subunit